MRRYAALVKGLIETLRVRHAGICNVARTGAVLLMKETTPKNKGVTAAATAAALEGMGGGGAGRIAALRAALRDEAAASAARAHGMNRPASPLPPQQALEAATRPLYASLFKPLVRSCEQRLGKRGSAHAGMDAQDLAILAWHKMMRYLAGPNGERVQDEEHFLRLLKAAAGTLFLDALDEQKRKAGPGGLPLELDAPVPGSGVTGTTYADLVNDTMASVAAITAAAPESSPDAFALPKDSRYLALVEELFSGDEAAFRRKYKAVNHRHPRQYRALIMCQLGLFFREEAGRGGRKDAVMARCIRGWVATLGIPPEVWAQVERAATQEEAKADEHASGEHADLKPPEDRGSESSGGKGSGGSRDYLPSGLLSVVNSIYGTNITGAKMLAVLRHDLNKILVR